MMTPPATTAQSHLSTTSEPTMPSKSARPSRFGLFFGIIAAVVTLGAIVLAVFAPQLTTSPKLQAPQGWQQVYNDNPGDTTARWANTSGCAFPSQGLHVWSDTACVFTPANNAVLANGVLIVAQVAPAADVSASEDAGISLDGTLIVIISQQGNYKICRETCQSFSTTGGILASGSTVAWHTDAYVPNEIAVIYNTDQGGISFYVNSQFVDQVPNADISSTPTIALMTSSSGEALFTHVTIYAGSVS